MCEFTESDPYIAELRAMRAQIEAAPSTLAVVEQADPYADDAAASTSTEPSSC